MTGLSRCGRQYPSLARAILAAELRTEKSGRAHVATGCAIGDHWHVVLNANANGKTYRPDPFPPPVRLLLARRDECCQRCGKYGIRLEAHHRRAKASGGSSARSHTQCTCNGVMLCRTCHSWVHLNPRKARAEGWIVLQSVSKPASIPVHLMEPTAMARHRHLTGYWWPTCEGEWNDEP